jgi:protein TonB
MTIEKDGSISHARIEHGISKDLDKEALRVINSLPKWKPAILNKKPVRDKYFIPVAFSLEKSN